jgi:hypothetical protein
MYAFDSSLVFYLQALVYIRVYCSRKGQLKFNGEWTVRVGNLGTGKAILFSPALPDGL